MEKKICKNVKIAVSADQRVKGEENKELGKYECLFSELRKVRCKKNIGAVQIRQKHKNRDWIELRQSR